MNRENPDASKRIDIYDLQNGGLSTISGTLLSEVKSRSSNKQQAATRLGGGGAGTFKNDDGEVLLIKYRITPPSLK